MFEAQRCSQRSLKKLIEDVGKCCLRGRVLRLEVWTPRVRALKHSTDSESQIQGHFEMAIDEESSYLMHSIFY